MKTEQAMRGDAFDAVGRAAPIVLRAAADYYGLRVEDLTTERPRRRHGDDAKRAAYWAAAWALRQATGATYRRLGAAMHNRGQTLRDICVAVADRRGADLNFDALVDRLAILAALAMTPGREGDLDAALAAQPRRPASAAARALPRLTAALSRALETPEEALRRAQPCGGHLDRGRIADARAALHLALFEGAGARQSEIAALTGGALSSIWASVERGRSLRASGPRWRALIEALTAAAAEARRAPPAPQPQAENAQAENDREAGARRAA